METITAEELETASSDELEKYRNAYIAAQRVEEGTEAYDEVLARWASLAEAENWGGLEALFAEGLATGSGGAIDQKLLEDSKTVAGSVQSTTDNTDFVLGYESQLSPLESATRQLDSATRTRPPPITGDYKVSDYKDWLQNISVGDKDRLSQALYVQGYYNSMNIQSIEDISDPTYFSNAIQGALRDAVTSAETLGQDVGMSAVPTLEEGGRFADFMEEEFEEASRIFLRDSGPSYYPTSYLQTTGEEIARSVLGRTFTTKEQQQYVAMANKLLDDQNSPARLRNEQMGGAILDSAGQQFAAMMDPEAAQARQVSNLMPTLDKLLGL